VGRPLARQVTDWDEYQGRLDSRDTVDLRARVSGFIEQAPFEEGTIVKQNDVLFIIDPRPYAAEVKRLEGELQRAEAQRAAALNEFQRIEPLRTTGAISESQFVTARQALESAAAAVQAAQAALESARLNLQWCRVTAPIQGRVSRKLVTPGNLVIAGTAGQGTLLTNITSLNPIYCYIDVDERSVLRYQRMIREHTRLSARDVRLPTQLALGDQDEFTREGYIDFVDNRIDPMTGTIRVRGVFPNPDRQLLPGFYARMRIPGRAPHEALLVPESAIGANLADQFVLVVGPDDVVQLRPVTVGQLYDGLREVEGIKSDDRVVLNGLVYARPGVKVRPMEVPIQPVMPATTRATTMPATTRAATTEPVTAPTTTATTTSAIAVPFRADVILSASEGSGLDNKLARCFGVPQDDASSALVARGAGR
jgi:RND family efflux transporter MFP subunit